MVSSLKKQITEERLRIFSEALNRILKQKDWSGSDLAREMQRHAPKDVEVKRHLPSAWLTGRNMPRQPMMELLCQTLGVPYTYFSPPGAGVAAPSSERVTLAQMTTTLDGKARLTIDTETDPETALEVLKLLRTAASAKRGAA